MGEQADYLIDEIINGPYDRRWGRWNDAYGEPEHEPSDTILTRHQGLAVAARMKSGGATRAAHEVGAVLKHLLSLPR
jgi:hypothetical protein